MIDGKNFFDQPINNMVKTYENIRKTTIDQGDDYATGFLLDYTYSKKYYKMIAVDLSKSQALDADPKATQQINFTANLDRNGNSRFSFILEEAKETVFLIFTRNCKSLMNVILLNTKYNNDKIQQFKSKAIKFTT